MMEIIAKLIKLTLIEMFDRRLIDWTPDHGAPESFIAIVEIEAVYYNSELGGGDYYVIVDDELLCLIDITYLDGVWHSALLSVEVN